MPSSESGALKRRLGKWSTPGVPHKGWTCIDTDDLGANDKQICQMCETSEIRWAHTMTHSDYKGQLVVGVVCAGHMEENLLRARNRERDVRNHAALRARWPHAKWRTSQAGNEYKNYGGYSCVLKEWPQG
jgi:hypothetical protein